MSRDPLHALRRLGQSPWYSYFRGRLAEAGFFRSLVATGAIRGAMLDPVTFARLIEAGSDFDGRPAAGPGRAGTIDRLLVEELRAGAELFEGIHRSSGGDDGFVAVELSPAVSRRPDEALARGRRLLEGVGRPNLMVRVPGTPDRADTIEALVTAGMSVAITCLYGAEQALAGLGALQRGLARRLRTGAGVSGPRALLAFHLRRLDLVVDEMLEERLRSLGKGSDLVEALLSRTGIATARAAHTVVQEALGGREWRDLRRAGAALPRLCWEGTTAADPRERDLRYVEELAGSSTVVVLAPTTIAGLRARGRVEERLSRRRDRDDGLFEDLRSVGIDLDEVADDLQGQEIDHRETMSRALPRIGTRGGPSPRADAGGGQVHAPGVAAGAFEEAIEVLREGGAAERLWLGGEPASSGAHGGAIPRRSAWLHGLEAMRDEILPVVRSARRLSAREGRAVLLLGAGGAGLGARACADAFERASFLALDSTVPGAIRRVERAVDETSGLLVVVCKSGSVPETRALTAHFEARWRAASSVPGERLVAITDPGTPLHAHATAGRFAEIWLDSPEIDGSLSMLSRSGLLPVALMGVDVGTLLARAHGMALRCAPEVEVAENPALRLGAYLAAVHETGRDKITLLAAGGLASLAAWVEQVLAVVTGKDGKGLVAVVDEPVATVSDYGPDRAFVHMRVATEEDPEGDALTRELEAAGHPVARLVLADPFDLGAEFFRWQMAAIVAAELIGVDGFERPHDVDATSGLRLGPRDDRAGGGRSVWGDDSLRVRAAPEADAELAARAAGVRSLSGWLDAHLGRLHPPDYLAIQAFLTPTVRVRMTLQRIRARIRSVRGVATTVAWGPGSVQSTGGLHRAGPATGLFLQLVADRPPDLEIPGEEHGFAALTRSRARAELDALLSRGRRAMCVDLGPDPAAGVERVLEALEAT